MQGMAVRCEHVHKLELQKFCLILCCTFTSWARNKDGMQFQTCMSNIRNTGITDK